MWLERSLGELLPAEVCAHLDKAEVGVYGDPCGLTEYEGELRALGDLLKARPAGEDEIYAFLRATGLPSRDARDRRAARMIAEWHERAMRRMLGPWPDDG